MARATTRQSLALSVPQFEDEKQARHAAVTQALLEEVRRIQKLLAGGTRGQLLTKSAAADYDGTWKTRVTGVLGALNLGTGHAIWRDLTAAGFLEFKTLLAGANITLTDTDTGVTITAAGLSGNFVPLTRKVNTGTYLTGGGALSADLTLDFDPTKFPVPTPVDTVLTWLDM